MPIILALLFLTGCAEYKPVKNMAHLGLYFLDPQWDGLAVPDGQHCRIEGGHGSTPDIVVRNIPPKTNALLFAYSDLDGQTQMREGGHGQIGYTIPTGTTDVTVPSIPGETFELPQGFFLIEPFRKQTPAFNMVGAYLPPCVRGDRYELTVKAVYKAAKRGERSLLLGIGHLSLGAFWPVIIKPPKPGGSPGGK